LVFYISVGWGQLLLTVAAVSEDPSEVVVTTRLTAAGEVFRSTFSALSTVDLHPVVIMAEISARVTHVL
jgi:hypothetical protein